MLCDYDKDKHVRKGIEYAPMDDRVGRQAVAVQRDMGAHRAPTSNMYDPVGGHACVV